MRSNTSLQMFASGGRYVTLLLSALALTVVVGCPDGGKVRVIDNLPSPAFTPIQPGMPSVRPNSPSSTTPQSIVGKTIMIDPGHGGHDPGAGEFTRSRVPEKTIVLDIGNRLAAILQDRGAKVICTRTTDTFPSLADRANAADRYRVNLFISIHANASETNSSASGADVYVYTAPSGESRAAAQSMASALQRAGIECNGVDRKNLHVLREHSRPGMLVECGFLTNSADARNLNSPAYRARLALAIADGATAYLTR